MWETIIVEIAYFRCSKRTKPVHRASNLSWKHHLFFDKRNRGIKSDERSKRKASARSVRRRARTANPHTPTIFRATAVRTRIMLFIFFFSAQVCGRFRPRTRSTAADPRLRAADAARTQRRPMWIPMMAAAAQHDRVVLSPRRLHHQHHHHHHQRQQQHQQLTPSPERDEHGRRTYLHMVPMLPPPAPAVSN